MAKQKFPAGNSAESAKAVRGRPFAPGQSGNPSGRPRIPEELRALEPNAIKALGEIIANPRHRDRCKAAEYVIDRIYGKPSVKTEVTGEGGAPLMDPGQTSAEKRETVAALLAAAIAKRNDGGAGGAG